MTPTLMYECVLSIALLMGPECGYDETINRVVEASKPDWIPILVQNIIAKPFSIVVSGYDLESQWLQEANALLIELVAHHGTEYRAQIEPLLSQKHTIADFFWVATCLETYAGYDDYVGYDVIDLVAHFADNPEVLNADELEPYAYLLSTQAPEKAILLLEKLRRDVADFTSMEERNTKTFYEILDVYIGQLKSRQRRN